MQSRYNENFIAFQTLLRKEVIRFARIWTQTLLPPAITMTLYFIIFGKLIGTQIGHIEGFTYMQYIVPGLIMMAMMTNAYANTAASFFGAKFSHSIEEILVAPVPPFIILMGYLLGATLRALIVGIIVTMIALTFTKLQMHHWGVVIAMSFLATTVFGLGGLINAIYAKKFDDVSYIPTFVLTPLTYLGGVFYSVKQLPPFWQKVAIFNPLFSMVDTFRYGILGISEANIYIGLALICFLCAILFYWCLYLLKQGIGLKY